MIWRLALKHCWREKSYSEFRILVLALFLAVFSVTTLSCLTKALHLNIVEQGAQLLGAELVIESAHPIAKTFIDFAGKHDLKTSYTVEFLSMVIKDEKFQLADIIAIDSHFPLLGTLDVVTDKGKQQFGPPPVGEIWVEENLALRLGVSLNQLVELGNTKLKVSGFILQRPVALADSSALAPSAYVNMSDLDKMAVLQPGSRATYRLLCQGEKSQLSALQNHFKDKVTEVTWVTPQKGRQALTRVVVYGERYLAVILLIQVFLAGIAIAMCAYQYSVRQQNVAALWRCLGATSYRILMHYLVVLFMVGVVTLSLSISLGYCLANFLLIYAKQYGIVQTTLGAKAGILGALTGIIMLMGFALPPLVSLRKISPIRIFQSAMLPRKHIFIFVLTVIVLGMLFIQLVGQRELAVSFAAQLCIIGVWAFIFAWLLWHLLVPLGKMGPLVWRIGIAYMLRHKWYNIIQWMIFTLVLTLLLLVEIIQHDFMNQWRMQLKPNTPNYFLLNIQPNQVQPLHQWFEAHGMQEVEFYPIVRARMTHINGIAVNSKQQPVRRGLQRAINLTWLAHLPKDNQIVSGVAWEKVLPGKAQISVEKGFADRQHLNLGDTISFQIEGELITGEIVQIRTVEWGTFKPNFFVIFAPNVIEDLPHSYITSIYLPKNKRHVLNELTKEYVEVSIIDVEALLENMRSIVAKMTLALESLLLLVLILGVLIMYAGILSTLKERTQESAMMQVLGATRKLVAKILLIEFGVSAIFASLVASIMALILAQDLASRFFELSFGFNVKWMGIGVGGGTILIVLFGLYGARALFRVSPLSILRAN